MKFLSSAVLALSLLLVSTPLLAADVSGDTYVQGQGGFYRKDDRSGPYSIGSDGIARLQTSSPSGTPNFATAQATVGATSTLIATARPGRSAITVVNLGTTPVYIGVSGVTASNGTLLPGAVGASLTIPSSAAVFGVASTGTQAVSVLETY